MITGKQPLKVLAALSSTKELASIAELCAFGQCEFEAVFSVTELADRLLHSDITVVLTDLNLADGSWTEVLEIVSYVKPSARVIVAAQETTDALWSEVLNMGGYGLICRGDSPADVYGTISLASRRIATTESTSPAPRAAASAGSLSFGAA
jgi:DNA-binding NarL/FixJ family response regulator